MHFEVDLHFKESSQGWGFWSLQSNGGPGGPWNPEGRIMFPLINYKS